MKSYGKLLFLALIAVFALSLSAAAADTPNLSVTAAKASAAPTIDGVLDDAAWLDASINGGKVVVDNAHTGDSITQLPRVAYVAYDEKALYVAFVNYSPNVDGLEVSNGPGSTSNNDEIELFVQDPAGARQHIIIDAAGQSDYAAAANFAVGKTSVQWIVEMEVSWEAAGMQAPKAGDEWLINFNGHQIADGAIWLAWNPTYGKFMNPSRFGTLVFGE